MNAEVRSETSKIKISPAAEPISQMSADYSKKREGDINVKSRPLKYIKIQKQSATARKGPITDLREFDEKHVTMRHNNENSLDWNYKDLREISRNMSEHGLGHNSSFHEMDICTREYNHIATPVVKSSIPQPFNVSNSNSKPRKRPHIRELQEIFSNEKKEGTHKRVLFWKETENETYTMDLFTYLLKTERIIMKSDNIATDMRACILNWLIVINGPEGNPAVVQTASWYFDSCLAVETVSLEKMRLTAAAAYWIAQKIHGRVANVASNMVKEWYHTISAQMLIETERAILKKLNFPPLPITPQEFITYFSWYCDEVHSTEIEFLSTIFCVAGLIVNKTLCYEYPSMIGAASVRNSVLLLRNYKMLAKLENNLIYKKAAENELFSNISNISGLQKRAVRLMASPGYENRMLLNYYDNPPYYTARKVISFVFNADKV